MQTQLAAKSKGAQKAAGALTAISAVRMRAGRVFRKDVIRDSVPGKGERVSKLRCVVLLALCNGGIEFGFVCIITLVP